MVLQRQTSLHLGRSFQELLDIQNEHKITAELSKVFLGHLTLITLPTPHFYWEQSLTNFVILIRLF